MNPYGTILILCKHIFDLPLPYVTIDKYSTESKQKFPFSDTLPPTSD